MYNTSSFGAMLLVTQAKYTLYNTSTNQPVIYCFSQTKPTAATPIASIRSLPKVTGNTYTSISIPAAQILWVDLSTFYVSVSTPSPTSNTFAPFGLITTNPASAGTYPALGATGYDPAYNISTTGVTLSKFENAVWVNLGEMGSLVTGGGFGTISAAGRNIWLTDINYIYNQNPVTVNLTLGGPVAANTLITATQLTTTASIPIPSGHVLILDNSVSSISFDQTVNTQYTATGLSGSLPSSVTEQSKGKTITLD